MANSALTPSWLVLPLTLVATAVPAGCVGRVAAVPASACCSLAALWVTRSRVRATLAHDPRRAFALALGASAAAFFIAIWIVAWHCEPLWVESAASRFREFPPGWTGANVFLTLLVLPALVALADSLAAALATPLRYVVRALVWPLAVLVVALSVVAAARHATHPRPASPVAHFPVVAAFTVPANEGAVTHHPVGALTLSVACVEVPSGKCHALLHRGPPAGDPTYWPVTLDPDRPSPREAGYAPRGFDLRVRHDDRRDLWVVESDGRPFAAFRGHDLARTDLDLTDFPGDFGPPLGWPVAALLGVALALWTVRRARYVAPPPDAPLLDAFVGADGMLHLPDGSTLRAPAGVVGAVVIAAPPASPAPYRDAAPPAVLRAGTVARWRSDLRDDADVRAALAVSTLVLLGTPLAVAAELRLLW